MPERASRHTRQTPARPYGLPLTGEMAWLMLRRPKGRAASRTAIFSFSRSRSISAAPSLVFSRSLSSSSPVVDLAVNAASPAARKASRHPVSVAAVTPSERDTSSRSSPRSSRSTAAVLRGRDILPPGPGDAAPDSRGRSASPGRVPTFLPCSMTHLLSRKSSAYEVSQTTVQRERTVQFQEVARSCRSQTGGHSPCDVEEQHRVPLEPAGSITTGMLA